MAFDLAFDTATITLALRPSKGGLLSRLLSRQPTRDLAQLLPEDRDLLLAIADLRALASERPDERLEITSDRICLSHRLAAALDAGAAETLGLPPLVDMTLRTDVEGVLGSPSFRLRHAWTKNGIRQTPQRNGAILKTSAGPRRLPEWLMDAIAVSEDFEPGGDDAGHWAALARFRQALDPGIQVAGANAASCVSMTDFLAGLQVRIADRFAISPDQEGNFDVVPFSGRRLAGAGFEEGEDDVPETAGELAGEDLRTFQSRVRTRGALPAYRVAPGSFVVVDRAAAPALDVMARMQRAPTNERAAFLRNPRLRITEAVEAALRQSGRLEGLDAAAEEEAIEAAAGPIFVETREFSERVTGVTVFDKPVPDLGPTDGATWLPEAFVERMTKALATLGADERGRLRERVAAAIDAGEGDVAFAGIELPARTETLALIDSFGSKATDHTPDDASSETLSGPVVLDTIVNFEALLWEVRRLPRATGVPEEVPQTIRTSLKQHQIDSFAWQVAAWKAGLPGVLNADEQGLGKTLQTIAFLVWLKLHTQRPEAAHRGPVLVVAPTSLLENWEQEVARHVREPGLGHLIRLYGSGVGGLKRAGTTGRDTDSGESKLDLGFLREAIQEGRAHRHWILTTYTTLTNYQHSLGDLPFSAVVFDEIQALKNPLSLRAAAARSVKADFRIGLTGTPIENSAVDLWAIMDQLAPGSLDSLAEFRETYGTPDEANMARLHARVFGSSGSQPPLALRRVKESVARDLPEKSRRLHPRPMPEVQSRSYEDARLKLAQGGLGAALKMLHHIRTVSVHPDFEATGSDADFIAASARVTAAFDILQGIAARGERALVFIEHRRMQHRFIELVRAEFRLGRIDLINGDTPISRRQDIVNRFQHHLHQDGGFDLLVLGPKAAGTGLTLTAATHVIHLSRWWNPAVEEQCNDRVHRLGQARAVTVHVPMAVHPGYREHSFDCLLHSLMQRKRKLAASALWPMGDTQEDAGALQRLLAGEHRGSGDDPVRSAMVAMFERDQQGHPTYAPDGSIMLH